MNARKMSKTKKPAKVEAPAKTAPAHKSAKRSPASAEFDDEDEPGTSKRPKPGATSPGSTKAKSADAGKSKAAKTSSKGKSDAAKGSAKASPSAGKAKAATSSGKAKAPSAGKAKAATSAGSTKAASSPSAGKAKAASKGKTASKGKGAAVAKSTKSSGEAKAAKGAPGKAAAVDAKAARGAAKRKGGAAKDELEAGEVELDAEGFASEASPDHESGEDREAAAGTITEEDDWIDAAEDAADSGERGEPLMSDISEIRGPRDAEGATDSELVEGEVSLSEDDISADSQPAPTTRAHLKRVVESLIFVADAPVSANQLGRLVKAKAAEVREVVTEIMRDYDGRGIELVEVSGGFQFRSAAASAPFVRDLVSARPVRLTRAQLETLALIAYRQPITRPEIDDVRGVDSGSAIKVLLDRDLVKILGRKDEAGRPLLYGTAPQFLDFFGMNTLQDLPTLREFTELSEENRELFAKKMGEVPEDLSDPAFEPVVQHQEYDDEGNPITPAPEPGEGVEAGTETPAGDSGEEGHVVVEDSELEIEAREARHEALSRDEDAELVDETDEDGETVAKDTELEDDSDEDEESDDEDDESDEDDAEEADDGEPVDKTDDESDDSGDDESDDDEDVDEDDEDDDESDEDEDAEEADDGEPVGKADDESDDSDDDESDEDEDEDVDEDDDDDESDEDEDAEEADDGEPVDKVDDEADEADDDGDDDEDEESDADEEESDDDESDDDDADEDEEEEESR